MLSLQIRKVGAGPPVHRMIDVHAKHVCSPSRYADLEHIGIQIVRSPSSSPADRSNQSNLSILLAAAAQAGSSNVEGPKRKTTACQSTHQMRPVNARCPLQVSHATQSIFPTRSVVVTLIKRIFRNVFV